MEKVDLVIAGLGVIALVATVVGVVTYEDGAHDYSIIATTEAFDAGQVTASQGTPVSVEVDVANNATHATVVVEASYSGQSVAGGSVTANVRVVGPDGTENTTTQSFTIAPAATGGSLGTIELDSTMWTTVPEGFRGSDDDAAALTTMWETPMLVEVTFEGPSGPLDNISYTAAISGDFHTYAATIDLPDVETA